MVYINYLLSHNQYDHAKNVVWPVVNNDLNYVAQYWNETGYDRKSVGLPNGQRRHSQHYLS